MIFSSYNSYNPYIQIPYMYESGEIKEQIDALKKRIDKPNEETREREEEEMMNTSMFNGIFGKIAPGMCRLSMTGKIAIKTTNGYKAYDYKTGRLTNCDNFALDIGEDFFFVIPTNKVVPGDIILAGGKPRCVLEVNKNEIKTFCYEDSSVVTIVPEHHMFMGKQYFYGKIISMFGDFGKSGKGMDKMMKFMMLNEMMKGNGVTGSNGFSSMLPLMLMMNSGEGFFEGVFDMDDEADEADEANEE